MGNSVLTLTPEQIRKMQDYYSKFIKPAVPQGGVFAAKMPACSITAYQSGKVLFQGKDAEIEALRWGAPSEPAAPKKAGSHLPADISSLSLIGSDEVGTGDYFGPITVVASYVKKEDLPLLKELGVQDSKNLKDDKIIEIAKQLVKFLPYSLMTLHNPKYNKLQASGMSQGKMKALLHNQAIGHVLDKIAPERPEGILIDEFAKEAIYYAHLKGQRRINRENVYFSTKAESIHLAVAASSMIARYAFIRHMDSLSKAAGIELPKGAGPKVDIAAAKLIQRKGSDCLNDFVKLHFANTEKAMKLVK